MQVDAHEDLAFLEFWSGRFSLLPPEFPADENQRHKKGK